MEKNYLRFVFTSASMMSYATEVNSYHFLSNCLL